MALLLPSVVFAFNDYDSYRERGIVEPYDIPAAIAFLVAAILAWRRSLAAVVGGAILCAIYLASVVTSGPAASSHPGSSRSSWSPKRCRSCAVRW